jgi:regulator of replication initiation timing
MNTEQPLAIALADVVDEVAVALQQTGEGMKEVSDELRRLHAENEALREALGAMLTHMGMDEDEWNKPTFDQARAALARAGEVK